MLLAWLSVLQPLCNSAYGKKEQTVYVQLEKILTMFYKYRQNIWLAILNVILTSSDKLLASHDW